ncbi:MAG: DoxX family protein [Legionellaceae bacterium]|nr:DoxX family protein [Legionellaceae bacterium]
MNAIIASLPTAGTFLIGFYFVFFGIWNTCHFTDTYTFMRTKEIPFSTFLLGLGISLQTLAGGLLMTGLYVPIAALVLIPFNLVAVFIFHDFWNKEGEFRRLNMIIFIANLTATLGALCLLLSTINLTLN